MPSEEEQPSVRSLKSRSEVAHLAVECSLVEIKPFDDLELVRPQGGDNVNGIVLRIGQRGRVLVVELPITSATRFSALAAEDKNRIAKKTMAVRTMTRPPHQQ